jgi:hypothetical protein
MPIACSAAQTENGGLPMPVDVSTATALDRRNVSPQRHAQPPDPVRNRMINWYAQLCQMAHSLGLTVDLEFPAWTETPDLT